MQSGCKEKILTKKGEDIKKKCQVEKEKKEKIVRSDGKSGVKSENKRKLIKKNHQLNLINNRRKLEGESEICKNI